MIKKKKILSLVTAAVLCFSMSSAAFADDIKGQGVISPDPVAVNVTVPGSFYWYADSTTINSGGTYDIKSGNYSITNNSVSPNLEVSLDAYTKPVLGATFATALESDITLNLTGDLAANGLGQDLLNYTTSPFGTYTAYLNGVNERNALLAPATPYTVGETWTFGFNGVYNQTTLPLTTELADYIITLTFTVGSFS